MSWGEAVGLVRELAKDPSSRLSVALHGYEFPWTREWAATVDLYDLMHQIAWSQAGGRGQRPKPYPRPWPEKRGNEHHYGNTEGRTRAEVVAYLNRLGHKIAG